MLRTDKEHTVNDAKTERKEKAKENPKKEKTEASFCKEISR